MLANLMSFFIVHLYCIFKSKIELNELVTKGNLMNYHHFTIDERESILIYRTKGLNFYQRGKIPISHTIHERPREANKRTRIGDWEADTVAGQIRKACLITLTDRYSRFLKIKKVAVKKSKLVIEAMVQMLEPLAKETVTPEEKNSRIIKT